MIRTALTIAGSDCTGGAGIQADLKTFAAHQIYGMSVITAVVAENTCRVNAVEAVSPKMIAEQLTSVFEDIFPTVVKIGMLPNPESIEVVADKLEKYQPKHIVVDPVMESTSGTQLMEGEALKTLIKRILPQAEVFTPNLPEAEIIMEMSIKDTEDMKKAARQIQEMGPKYVLVKGGHLAAGRDAKDILFDGENFYSYTAPRIDTKNTHGTGCTFSSAIAANLALDKRVPEAVSEAKHYMTGVLTYSLPLGEGNGPTNHFYEFYPSWEID